MKFGAALLIGGFLLLLIIIFLFLGTIGKARSGGAKDASLFGLIGPGGFASGSKVPLMITGTVMAVFFFVAIYFVFFIAGKR